MTDRQPATPGEDLPASAEVEAAGAGGQNVTEQATSGVLWLTVQKWVVRLVGFVTIAVLTRLLTPESFGVVAAAGTVLPFFNLIVDLGFAAYIVQADDPDEGVLSTGFWFSAIAGVVLCGALVGIAPLLGLVFRDAQVVPVLQALAACVLLIGLSSVPIALLRRAMRFRTLAWQGAVAAVVSQIGAIILAVQGFGVWALVGQTLISPAIVCVLSWRSVNWRPRLLFSRRDFATMARFGSQVLGVEFVAMTRAWAEAAIVSGTLGMAGLGYLNIAQRIVQITQDLTGGAVVPVSTVAFAKVRESGERLRAAYVRALRVTYAAMSPPLTLLAISAPLVVPIVFGDGWSPSYQVAQVLALAATLTVGAALDHGLFYGLGKPGQWFWFALITDAVTVGVTALTAQYGLVAIALGFLAVAMTATFVRWFLVARLIDATPAVVVRPFGFLVTAVVVPGAAGLGVLAWSAQLPPLVSVLLAGVAVLACYLVVLRVLARDVIGEFGRVIRRFGWFRRRPFGLTVKEDPRA
jgi:O-antigen/teichoic acid export membrane protein